MGKIQGKRILTLPSLKAWGFSLLRESLESTELNPDNFPDLKTAQRAFLGIAHPYLEVKYITGLPTGRGLRPMIFGSAIRPKEPSLPMKWKLSLRYPKSVRIPCSVSS